MNAELVCKARAWASGFDRSKGAERQNSAYYIKALADALEAATKPHTITTPVDLEALPEGSLILSHSEYPRYTGTVWRVSSGRVVEKVGRESEGVTPFGYFKDPLPATVIHEPDAS